MGPAVAGRTRAEPVPPDHLADQTRMATRRSPARWAVAVLSYRVAGLRHCLSRLLPSQSGKYLLLSCRTARPGPGADLCVSDRPRTPSHEVPRLPLGLAAGARLAASHVQQLPRSRRWSTRGKRSTRAGLGPSCSSRPARTSVGACGCRARRRIRRDAVRGPHRLHGDAAPPLSRSAVGDTRHRRGPAHPIIPFHRAERSARPTSGPCSSSSPTVPCGARPT